MENVERLLVGEDLLVEKCLGRLDETPKGESFTEIVGYISKYGGARSKDIIKKANRTRNYLMQYSLGATINVLEEDIGYLGIRVNLMIYKHKGHRRNENA